MSKFYIDEMKDVLIDRVPEYLTQEEYDAMSEDDFMYYVQDEMGNDITGAIDGSFTYDREEAKQFVLKDNFDTVEEAIADGMYSYEEFGKDVIKGNWESIDIVCRWMGLNQAAVEYYREHDKF